MAYLILHLVEISPFDASQEIIDSRDLNTILKLLPLRSNMVDFICSRAILLSTGITLECVISRVVVLAYYIVGGRVKIVGERVGLISVVRIKFSCPLFRFLAHTDFQNHSKMSWTTL